MDGAKFCKVVRCLFLSSELILCWEQALKVNFIVNWMLPTSNLSREIAYSTDSIDMSLLRWRIIFLIPVPALS